MKLLGLTLTHYAHFDNVSLDLSGGHEGLHLVYGANEAGKSAMLRAVRGLLFGVEVRSADTFRYGAQALRIGATLQGSGGAVIRVVRRKGQKNTLLDEAGSPLDESVLTALLGGGCPASGSTSSSA